MSKKIFVEKKINCPACGTHFHISYPNPKMYAPTSRDKDQRVTAYTWTGGIKTHVLPHHYAVQQCPTCFLADFTQKLEAPEMGGKEKHVHKVFTELSPPQRLVLRKLWKSVRGGEITGEGAIAYHLSAVYSTLSPRKPELIDHLKLGRLYLRLSWLYKEQKELESPPAEEGGKKPAGSQTLHQLTMAVEELGHAIHEAGEAVETIRHLAQQRMEELKLETEGNPYDSLVDTVDSYLDHVLQAVSQLEERLVQDKNHALTVSLQTKSADLTMGDAGESITETIAFISGNWPEIPRSEEQALKLAVEAFEYGLKHEAAELSIQQGTVLSNLTLVLLRQIGELDRALDYSIDIYKNGFRDKQALQMQLNEGKQSRSMKVEEAKAINRTISTLNNILSMATESRRELLKQIFERDKETIHKVMTSLREAEAHDQIKALAEAGIRQEIITWMKEHQMFNTETKKKKWFGR